MSYGKFNTYEEVATKFSIKLKEYSFLQEKEIDVKEDIFDFINDNLKSRRSYINENAICENIISPILKCCSKTKYNSYLVACEI